MPATGLHVVITGDPKAFQAALASAGGSLSAFGAKQQTVGKKLSSAGASMTKGIALPIIAVGAASANVAMKFEKQMSALKAAAGAPGPVLEQLRKSAMRAGADTAYSAREAAVAQTELAKGGLAAADILKGGLSGALALAAAGELELGEAASITSDSLNLFGLQGKDATSVADAMAAAANSTTADVADFGMALKQAGSVANTVGYSFTDTMVVLEALAKAGIKNSDAGTSMKTSLIQLVKPTDKQANLAKSLGLNFRDASGELLKAGAMSGILRAKLGGMSKAQRTATLATLAGTDGVRTLTSLYAAGPKVLGEYEKQLTKGGSAAKAAATKQDNLAGKVEQLKGSLETLGIMIGTVLIPPLTSLAVKVTKVANKIGTAFSSMPKSTQQLILVGAGVLAALGPVLFIAGKLATAFTALKVLFAGFSLTAGAVTAPVLLIVAALAALAVGLIYAYKHSAQFRATVQSAVAGVSSAFSSLVASLKPAISGLVAALKPLARALGPILGAAVKVAVPIIQNAVQTIAGVLKGLVYVVTGVVKIVTGILMGDFSKVWAGVKMIFRGAIGAIVAILKGAVGNLGAVAGLMVKAIGGAIKAGFGLVKGAFVALFKIPFMIGKAAVGALAGVGGALVKALVAAFRAGLGLFKSAASAVGKAGLAALSALVGAAGSVGKAIIGAAVGAVRAAVGAAGSAAKAVGSAALNGLRTVIGGAGSIGRAIIQGLINGIRSMAAAALSAAVDVAKGALSAVKKALKERSPSRVTFEMGENFSAGLAGGIADGADAVARAASSAAGSAGQGLLFGLDGAIAEANARLDSLSKTFEAKDKAAERRRLRRTADRTIYGDKKHASQDSDTKQARADLVAFNREAARTRQLSKIQLQITGMERVRAFKDSISNLTSQLQDFAKEAADAFREAGTKKLQDNLKAFSAWVDANLKSVVSGIDARLEASMTAINATMTAQLAALASGAGAELAGLQAQDEAEKRAQEDADAQEAIATATTAREKAVGNVAAAEDALRRAQVAGNSRAVAVMQARLAAAQQAATGAQTALNAANASQAGLERSRREQELQEIIERERTAIETQAEDARNVAQTLAEDQRTIAQATADYQQRLAEAVTDAKLAQLERDTANFQTALGMQLLSEIAQLQMRKQSYSKFAKDVQSILASVGLTGAQIGGSDDEAAYLAYAGAFKPKPKARPKPRGRATGGRVTDRMGEFAKVGETGVETLMLPRGARVMNRDQTSRGAGSSPAIGTLNVYPQGVAGNDEQALANWLGFRFATTRR